MYFAVIQSLRTDSFSAKVFRNMPAKHARCHCSGVHGIHLKQRLELLLGHFSIKCGPGAPALVSARRERVLTGTRTYLMASVHLSWNCVKLTLNISVRRSSCVS